MDLVLGTKRAVAHSPDCRARVEAAMLASGFEWKGTKSADVRHLLATSEFGAWPSQLQALATISVMCWISGTVFQSI